MKDLVDIFESNERRFFGREGEKEARCSYCGGTFYNSDLSRVGEQVIKGKYVRNAKACIHCEPYADTE